MMVKVKMTTVKNHFLLVTLIHIQNKAKGLKVDLNNDSNKLRKTSNNKKQ